MTAYLLQASLRDTYREFEEMLKSWVKELGHEYIQREQGLPLQISQERSLQENYL